MSIYSRSIRAKPRYYTDYLKIHRTLVITTMLVTNDFAVEIEFAVIKKLDMDMYKSYVLSIC